MNAGEIAGLVGGLLGGLILSLTIAFAFFFGAEKTILRTMAPVIADPRQFRKNYDPAEKRQQEGFGIAPGHYFSTGFRLRKARSVKHYSQDFLDTIFKRHHFAGMMGIALAFIFLIVIGFFLDYKLFQVPAAASIFVFFAVMIAVIGAFSYLLQSWSLIFLIALLFVINILYEHDIIDPRNKAYGLNYTNRDERPVYDRESLEKLCSPEIMELDKKNMLGILENWKKKQHSEKPVMVFINVSGGGLRSATFVMNTLQQLDSITHGELMQHTFLVSGASGGMLAAVYYRELYRKKLTNPSIDLHSPHYTDNIAQDLLNPMFSSMIDRDIFAPAQKFSVTPYQYVKDRGYAFEEKLNDNTGGVLNTQFRDYIQDEKKALVPLAVFNSVISRDGRKMMLCSQPLSFMMRPLGDTGNNAAGPDAVDYAALFSKQDPYNTRLLTALRMNATFPYVLPNVWLPTNPVIDVMDAGLRDNFGQETSLRFIDHFKDWIKENTGGVILLQLRDRPVDNWQQPFEGGSVTDIFVKPATMLQSNWYKLQSYSQNDQYTYFANDTALSIQKIRFMYVPLKKESGAALNFHLTAREKKDVIASFDNQYNRESLLQLVRILK